MAANTQPIFTKTPSNQWISAIVAANTGLDISSGTSYLVFTAGANGSLVKALRIKASPGQAAAATALRVFVNNGGVTGTKANSQLIGEMGLPASLSSQVNANPDLVFPLNLQLDPGHKIYVTIGTAPGGSAEWNVLGEGGHY